MDRDFRFPVKSREIQTGLASESSLAAFSAKWEFQLGAKAPTNPVSHHPTQKGLRPLIACGMPLAPVGLVLALHRECRGSGQMADEGGNLHGSHMLMECEETWLDCVLPALKQIFFARSRTLSPFYQCHTPGAFWGVR